MSGGIQMHAIFMTQQLLKAPASVINTWKAVSVSSPGVGSTSWPGTVWTQSFWSRHHTGSPPKCFREIISGKTCAIISNKSLCSNEQRANLIKVGMLKLHQSFTMLWKLLDLLLRWDCINTLQVGYAGGNMSSKHLLFITLQEINTSAMILCGNLIKSFKTKNEQHVLRQDQNVTTT